MKIEQGYVAATPEGEYLVWYESTTHTGYHLSFGTVSDIDKACFRLQPEHWPSRHRHAVPEHIWVPVERRIEIELKGYGS